MYLIFKLVQIKEKAERKFVLIHIVLEGVCDFYFLVVMGCPISYIYKNIYIHIYIQEKKKAYKYAMKRIHTFDKVSNKAL